MYIYIYIYVYIYTVHVPVWVEFSERNAQGYAGLSTSHSFAGIPATFGWRSGRGLSTSNLGYRRYQARFLPFIVILGMVHGIGFTAWICFATKKRAYGKSVKTAVWALIEPIGQSKTHFLESDVFSSRIVQATARSLYAGNWVSKETAQLKWFGLATCKRSKVECWLKSWTPTNIPWRSLMLDNCNIQNYWKSEMMYNIYIYIYIFMHKDSTGSAFSRTAQRCSRLWCAHDIARGQ